MPPVKSHVFDTLFHCHTQRAVSWLPDTNTSCWKTTFLFVPWQLKTGHTKQYQACCHPQQRQPRVPDREAQSWDKAPRLLF